MNAERKQLTSSAAIRSRQTAAATVQRSAAAPPRTLQERLGNHGTQAFIARAAKSSQATTAKLPAKVSKKNEPAELEAEETARKVVRMREPSPATLAAPKGNAKGTVQRAEAASPVAVVPASSRVNIPGGAPLPPAVRGFMEPRFGASFGNVRVHTGEAAAQQSADLNAHAFTVGEHVFFGRNKFQPQSAGGRELIAHELAHTIQQGSAVQRSADTTITQRTEPRVQRFGIGDALDWIADKANYIPGFRLLTIVLGMNPINFASVDRSAANLLRALLELIPGVGPLIVQALDNYGIFEKVGAWMEGKVKSLGLIGSAIKSGLDKFLDSLSWRDIFDLDDVYERGKRIFTDPIDQLIALGKSVVVDILVFIRDAILMPLAKLAEGTRGWDLLKAVLGKDPITGLPVPRNAETMIGGFMKLIGEEEVWENIKKANAIPRAWAWFQAAVEGLKGIVMALPANFINALKSLEIIDLIIPPKAFLKIGAVFGSFIVDFLSWAGNAAWDLLLIVFDVVSPGALAYIKKTGAALKSILKNPLPFVHNLVGAAKLGFANFKEHFFKHLQAGLIDWLTGSLPGIYIPKAFSLPEIAKFAFSVLGISWANIRQKLVKATSETAVKAMETGFDIVVTLVREGPAAAWDKIKEQLANLKDMVIGGITSMVVDMVVKQAIPKMIAMFIPGAGFITAIISIYDTIMVFVHKISKIIQVVRAFVDSLVGIAAGAVDAAAARVEETLAGLLSLAINFLAGFAGFGNVAEKVMGVIEKIRAPIDKALDWLVNWIVTAAKTLFAKGKAAVGKLFSWAFATSNFKDEEGKTHSFYVNDAGMVTVASTPQAAKEFVEFYVGKHPNKKALGDEIKVLIKEAQAIVDDISKTSARENQVPAPAKQKKLLEVSKKIGEMLGKMVGGDRKVGKLAEKYLLEGQVGTYAGSPKAVGDQLTPDHQPQASVILAAADYFRKKLKIRSGPLADRAASRAAQGYAINLHFKRHVAGATYGSKGETREGFYEKLVAKAGTKPDDEEKAKATVVGMLRDKLKEDVTQMKGVAKEAVTQEKVWGDLNEVVDDDAKRKALKEQIADRIVSGENQIASQPFDF